MLKTFVNKNVAVLFLVVITTIDASRLFYLPLPKVHSIHRKLDPSSSLLYESANIPDENLPVSDEFMPASEMERYIYDELQGSEKREDFDWDTAVDDQLVKHLIAVNEGALDDNELEYLFKSLHRATRKPSKLRKIDDEVPSLADSPAQRSEQQAAKDAWAADTAASRTERLQSNAATDNIDRRKHRNDVVFLVIVGTSSLVGILGIIAAAIFWYKIHKNAKATLDSEYPSYGITGPGSGGSKMSPSSTLSDRKLAQSAQMFHYQQQRQQMMAQEKAHLDPKPVHSDDSDDEAPGGGDYTVYECPGLAPTGEMEVRNPLFTEPDSPLTTSEAASHPTTDSHHPQPATTASSSPPKDKLLS